MAKSIATGDLGRSLIRPAGPNLEQPRLPAVALVTALVVLGWFLTILTTHYARFVVFTPEAKTGFDVSLSLLSLFVALVLTLFPTEDSRDRLRWVALGFAILGVGGLVFGYLAPLVYGTDDLERAMYCSLAVRTMALLAIAIGMAPANAPPLSRRNLAGMLLGGVALVGLAIALSTRLPELILVEDLEAVADSSDTTLEGLTGWHWVLSTVPFVLGLVAAAGTVRHAARITGGVWLTIAMVLMAGSQLHTMFWPSAYSPVLTTASILRLGFTLVVAIGAVFALRQVAVERASVLAAEQELSRSLAELSRLRTDFTAMVAHELASPVAALQAFAAMLGTGGLSQTEQVQTAAAIRAETGLIRTMIDDIRMAARAERDDFDVRTQPVQLRPLIEQAANYGRSLPGDHPIEVQCAVSRPVPADPDRIGQVLRNLVANACKHTPPATEVTILADDLGDRVRVAVVDRGQGIAEADRERIFEKFGRGRSLTGERVPGVGLGLYICRRILRAHNSHLELDKTDGGGATFWFELPFAARNL